VGARSVLRFRALPGLGGWLMSPYDAVMIAEDSGGAADTPEQIEAWQYLVSSGMAWTLQGWFGRRAADLIAEGVIYG
jgi:hypothetical protein